MKQAIVYLCVAALASGVAFHGANAQAKKKPAKAMPSEEEMMKRWEQAMTPGDTHKKLEAFVGSWDVEVKAWMKGPKEEPTVSKGSAEYKMALGGRYLQQEVTGEMMGQPFNGIGYTGYDNFRKRLVSFWIDNMGTAMSMMEGKMDGEGKTLTLWGKMDEPATGEKDKKVKYVTRIVDKDKHVFEMYDIARFGEKQPVMVLTYTRK
ncbi:MAG TPA: DUF1579 domain-containing protein [Bacteroidota bacterium]|nr:DUF1579 domain-containing protein [Bacteroidota bacterium]